MRPILIIKTGETFPEIASVHGDFENWIISGFDSPENSFNMIDARTTVSFPDPGNLSAIVITGSHAMVTDRPPWYQHLTGWIRRLRGAGVPTLGICFGHQLLADTFGGRVGDNIAGREIGTRQIQLTAHGMRDPVFAGLPPEFAVQESHAQEVQIIPPDAVLLAGNKQSRIQAFYLDPCIWGIQFHPEFSADIMLAYVNALSSSLIREDLHPDQVIEKISATPHAPVIFNNFLDIIRDLISKSS